MSAFLKLKTLNPALWGFSIALSWTWGLGLFFSVQVAIQFGMAGLLGFAIPNAIGLMAFGFFTQYIANKFETGLQFEKHFFETVGRLRWVFLLYQILAIALTFFTLIKYVFLPMNLNATISPYLIGLLILGAALLMGEVMGIARLKWQHFGFSMVIVVSILLIGWGGGSYFRAAGVIPRPLNGMEPLFSSELPGLGINTRYLGLFMPILVGFLLGPWLDIQQWQRAIQIRREKTNVRTSYVFGGIIFFGILLFHGTLALSMWTEGARLGIAPLLLEPSPDNPIHVKDAVVRFLFVSGVDVPKLFQVFYVIFLCLCITATLDSGYVALKWFQTDTAKKSDMVLLSLLPSTMVRSPLVPFFFAALLGIVGVWLKFELEYYMAFYGSFLVGYALVFLFKTTYVPRFASFTQTTLFSLAAASTGIFGVGYFEDIWLLLWIGALTPLVHAIVCIASRKAYEEMLKTGTIDKLAAGDVAGAVKDLRAQDWISHKNAVAKKAKEAEAVREKEAKESAEAPSAAERVEIDDSSLMPPEAQPIGESGMGASCWLEGKWFVHTFMATYQDTNSVGNVYFAQYAMWVGKTRELFFNHALPDWDLKTTSWYILTRSFEHKYLQETTEFTKVMVKIRIAGFNRKFVTMEHQVYDSAKTLLGKGKQVLLFVSSKDYAIIDIPAECMKGFLPYIPAPGSQ